MGWFVSGNIKGPKGDTGSAGAQGAQGATGAKGDATNVPVGTHLAGEWSTASAPSGYLVPDGTVYNISAYPALAAHYALTYGASNHHGGDGTTTFAVPDTRERTYVNQGGSDIFAVLGGKTGEKNHALTAAEGPAHSHAAQAGLAYVGYTSGAGLANWATGSALRLTTMASTAGSGSGDPHNVVQPSFVCRYVIRAA